MEKHVFTALAEKLKRHVGLGKYGLRLWGC